MQIHFPQSFKQTKFDFRHPSFCRFLVGDGKNFNECRTVENIKDINKIVKNKRRVPARLSFMDLVSCILRMALW